MRSPARLFIPLVVLTACQSRLCRDPSVWSPTEYTAPKVATAPSIDGDLSDPLWQQVPWSVPFQWSGSMGQADQLTRAKLAWDDKKLYVAFEVEDTDIVTNPKYTHDDDPLYEVEVVEIFLDADNNDATYNEIEVSPDDHLFDASFVGRRQGMNLGWASGTQHAVKLRGTINNPNDRDSGWSAELAVPFETLSALPTLPPQAGQRWKFNLFRLDHTHGQGEKGQAFSPVMMGDFHNLPKFGTLVFGGPI